MADRSVASCQRSRVRDFDLTWRAIFALTVSYSAYLAEIFRAGIEAVAEGPYRGRRIRSAFPAGKTFRLIIFPQAIRTVLPPLGNDFVAMIKDSALVSALGVQDITQLGKVYSASTFLFFETYNVVAFLYLVMTLSLSLLVRGTGAKIETEWLARSHRWPAIAFHPRLGSYRSPAAEGSSRCPRSTSTSPKAARPRRRRR